MGNSSKGVSDCLDWKRVSFRDELGEGEYVQIPPITKGMQNVALVLMMKKVWTTVRPPKIAAKTTAGGRHGTKYQRTYSTAMGWNLSVWLLTGIT